MGEVVNLRQARKAKSRDAAHKAAQENRAKFGQTKAQKAKSAHEEARAAKAHDGHRRDKGPSDESDDDPC